MKFFFPDSQDQIDPSFDFRTEERSILRVRQRDDLYAHEALVEPVLDGLLVSKAIVDGIPGATGKYTLAQRQRLYREGVRRFFRLDNNSGPAPLTMGDCGAFNYWREETPPYSPDQVIDFYDECRFDLGISVDHVILGYDPRADHDSMHPQRAAWQARQSLTLDLAREFLAKSRARKVSFEPLGVAQGWSPASYARAVKQLQEIGYTRIAIGGMVPLKTNEILDSLKSVANVRDPYTQLHLLGITRCNNISDFANFGVTSFDSTSAFRQAFKDDKDNYHVLDRTFTAVRVPQVDGNPKLKKAIAAGQISQKEATVRERECLAALYEYDRGNIGVQRAVTALMYYEELFSGRHDYTDAYTETLQESPWKYCECRICGRAGINVILFRGSERNKRRGFHNLYVFRQRLDRELAKGAPHDLQSYCRSRA
jgi:hypothetical protein